MRIQSVFDVHTAYIRCVVSQYLKSLSCNYSSSYYTTLLLCIILFLMKKRTKEQKEKILTFIANLEIKKPSLVFDDGLFAAFVAKKFHISIKQAKKDIEEVRKRKRELSLIDLKAEFVKKKQEYAFIKEQAIKKNNLNAYLGAVNKEAEMLNLERFAIFNEIKEEEKSNLEEKKKLLFDKLFNKE